jgi:hypothetical protein
MRDLCRRFTRGNNTCLKPWSQLRLIKINDPLHQQLGAGKNLVPYSLQQRRQLLTVLQLPVDLSRSSIGNASALG